MTYIVADKDFRWGSFRNSNTKLTEFVLYLKSSVTSSAFEKLVVIEQETNKYMTAQHFIDWMDHNSEKFQAWKGEC